VEERGVDQSDRKKSEQPGRRAKAPYEPPRILTDEAFEQISLACMTKIGTKKNFT
jgi:hypothetical protein